MKIILEKARDGDHVIGTIKNKRVHSLGVSHHGGLVWGQVLQDVVVCNCRWGKTHDQTFAYSGCNACHFDSLRCRLCLHQAVHSVCTGWNGLYGRCRQVACRVAGNMGIDATSERLLQDDALRNQDLRSYQKLSSIDKERLEIISRLRTHAQLLERYFSLLNELATSDAPERAQQAVGGVVDGLNSLGKQLRGSELVPNKDAFTAVTKLAIQFKMRSVLKDELDKHKDTIQVELKTQQELLKVLAKTIQHDLTIINEVREQRLVINPLIATEPISRPDEWVAHRRVILTSEMKMADLSTASDAARKLREAFEDLISGKLDLERVNILLSDLESILVVAEAINH